MFRSILPMLFLLIALPAFPQSNIFVVPPLYPAANQPFAAAVGDFNGDGKLDLAVANTCPVSGCGGSGSGVISILLGNGDGTFRPHVDYTLLYPQNLYPTLSIVAADLNGDGRLDLAVAAGNVVSVYIGNGDGTFQAHVDYATPGTDGIAVGDFNGDGKPDIATANFADNSVSIFLNSGTGIFPTRADFSTGDFPTSVIAGDFNGDGKLDLAVTTFCGNVSGCYTYQGPGSVSILLGNGDGTFQSHVDYTVGIQPTGLVAADLNGDTFLDLVVANDTPQTVGSASVLFGKGDGTFQTQKQYLAGQQVASVVVGDFNGDGQLDFAVTNRGDNNVAVYLNQGSNSFSQPNVRYSAYAGAAVAGDFNQDHKLDLAVLDDFGSGGVQILLGKGDSSFSQTGFDYWNDGNPVSLAVRDLNGDSKNDVAVANYIDNSVSLFFGNGDGTFQVSANLATGNGPSSVAIADLNHDGNQDLAVANTTDNTVSVLLNSGAGVFAAHVDYPTAAAPAYVAIGDVNGDGKPDLLVACASEVSILLGNGDGTFQARSDTPPGGSWLALGDFNGDGFLDFAAVTGHGVAVLLNNGHGGFTSQPFEITTVGGYSVSVTAGDFNRDGKLDLAVGQVSYPFGVNSVAIYLGNGDGTFQNPQTFATAALYPAVADFNGDGVLDLAFSNVLLLGLGNGAFVSAQQYPTGIGSYPGLLNSFAAAGDFNGDGRPDLATVTSIPGLDSVFSSNTLDILLNTGQTSKPDFSISAPPSTTPGSVSAGQSAGATVTLQSSGWFNGTVSLICSVTPIVTSGPTCTLSPPQLKLGIVGSTTSTLKISTTGPSAALVYPNLERNLVAIYAAFFPLFGIAWAGIGIRRRGRKGQGILALMICCLLVGGVVFQVACGGSSSPTKTSGGSGTPAGSYTITITGSASLQHSTTLKLTVQ